MAVICLVALLAVFAAAPAHAQDWKVGRATAWGFAKDGWSIFEGHCMYGKFEKNDCTGWNVGALSDQHPLFNKDDSSCGLCLEVACKNAKFLDGYQQEMDRTSVCHDESKSLIIQIADRCPCVYPNNAYANKRWCCGDMDHVDLSAYAFAQLGDIGKGSMQIWYRKVSCNAVPANPANGNFKLGEPAMNMKEEDWGKQKKKPCDGGKDKLSPVPGFPQAAQMAGGKRFAPKPRAPACSKTVRPGGQCGGVYRKKGGDYAWKGFCCKSGYKCKRRSRTWYSCAK